MPVLVDTLRQFLHRTSGSVTMIFAVVIMALFTFIGLAVDYSRWSNAHSKSVDALDAALLAAGRALQSEPDTSAAIAVAKSTFLANARDRLSLLDPTIDVQLVDNGTALEGKAHGRIATPFLAGPLRANGAQGVVIAMQANPDIEDFGAGRHPRGFDRLMKQLLAETRAFAGEVLLIHGDTHLHRIDQPLKDPASGETIRNFTRLETYGSPFMGWVKVAVAPGERPLFRFQSRPYTPRRD